MSPKDPIGPSSKGGSTPPMTDLELMLWVDGELDPARAIEVEAFVQRDARARAVVSALRLGSEVVAGDALQLAESFDADVIADGVMDAIDAEASRRLMAPVKRAPAWRAPATAAAALALAMAAAWMFILPNAERRGAPIAERPGAPPSTEVAPAVEPGATEASVFIDIVDFGARPGTIFYVPSEDESMLPVVWLTDDDTPPSGDGL